MNHEALNLYSSTNENNINLNYSGFQTNLNSMYNKYFPLIRMSRKQFKQKPYITKGILVSIRHKNRLLKKYLAHNTDTNERNYKRFRNKLVNVIKRSEENYHSSLISKYNNSALISVVLGIFYHFSIIFVVERKISMISGF